MYSQKFNFFYLLNSTTFIVKFSVVVFIFTICYLQIALTLFLKDQQLNYLYHHEIIEPILVNIVGFYFNLPLKVSGTLTDILSANNTLSYFVTFGISFMYRRKSNGTSALHCNKYTGVFCYEFRPVSSNDFGFIQS